MYVLGIWAMGELLIWCFEDIVIQRDVVFCRRCRMTASGVRIAIGGTSLELCIQHFTSLSQCILKRELFGSQKAQSL